MDSTSARKSAIVPGAIKKPPPKKGCGRTKSATPPTITKTRSQRKAQQAALEAEVVVHDESENDEGDTVEIQDEDYVTILELINMQNEVLQEMSALPKDLRTTYYFEQSFAAKLHSYKDVTAQGLVRMYTNMVDYKLGDEMKVAKVKKVVDETYDEGTLIMMKKVNTEKKDTETNGKENNEHGNETETDGKDNKKAGKENKTDGKENKTDGKENAEEDKTITDGNKENNKIETTKIHEPDSTNDVQLSPEDEGKKTRLQRRMMN